TRMYLVYSSILLILAVYSVAAHNEDNSGEMKLLVVTGRLLCDGEVSSRVMVALTDEDRVENGSPPLSLRTSDAATGNFSVSADLFFFEDNVDPTIEIVHKCHRRCIEKSRIRIPWEFAIERGPKEIDLHTIELSQEFPLAEETTFCTAESDVTWTVPGKNPRD
ncbi:hypothetical protein PFISCL1PPCAC_26569, partial [Pristionchus fissidentatus]